MYCAMIAKYACKESAEKFSSYANHGYHAIVAHPKIEKKKNSDVEIREHVLSSFSRFIVSFCCVFTVTKLQLATDLLV